MRTRGISPPAGVYIVLPANNRRAVTANFCDCLARQSHSNYFLVLVDDGSSDATAKLVGSYAFWERIMRADKSIWWARGLRGTAYFSSVGRAKSGQTGRSGIRRCRFGAERLLLAGSMTPCSGGTRRGIA